MCFACDSWSVTVANPSPPQPSSSAGGLGWPSASSTFHICSLPSPPGLLGPVLRNAAVRVNLHSWLFTSNLAQLCRPHQQLCAQPCYYLDYTPPAHSSGLHLNERGEKEGERERERRRLMALVCIDGHIHSFPPRPLCAEHMCALQTQVGACGSLSPLWQRFTVGKAWMETDCLLACY